MFVIVFAYSISFALKVKTVIDGDTLILDNVEKVRMIRVDTPETLHPTKPVQYFAKEAKEFTKSVRLRL